MRTRAVGLGAGGICFVAEWATLRRDVFRGGVEPDRPRSRDQAETCETPSGQNSTKNPQAMPLPRTSLALLSTWQRHSTLALHLGPTRPPSQLARLTRITARHSGGVAGTLRLKAVPASERSLPFSWLHGSKWLPPNPLFPSLLPTSSLSYRCLVAPRAPNASSPPAASRFVDFLPSLFRNLIPPARRPRTR